MYRKLHAGAAGAAVDRAAGRYRSDAACFVAQTNRCARPAAGAGLLLHLVRREHLDVGQGARFPRARPTSAAIPAPWTATSPRPRARASTPSWSVGTARGAASTTRPRATSPGCWTWPPAAASSWRWTSKATSPFVGGTGSMVEMLRHALNVHANHPAYLRVDGKPVLFFWRQQRWGVGTWQSIRDQVDPEPQQHLDRRGHRHELPVGVRRASPLLA